METNDKFRIGETTIEISQEGFKYTLPEGVEVLNRIDGTQLRKSPDGEIKCISPDGKEKHYLPNGTVIRTYPDGKIKTSKKK